MFVSRAHKTLLHRVLAYSVSSMHLVSVKNWHRDLGPSGSSGYKQALSQNRYCLGKSSISLLKMQKPGAQIPCPGRDFANISNTEKLLL
jgi:hypothetical protein